MSGAATPWRLRRAAASLRAERVSLAELAEAHGAAAQGSLLVMIATVCLLPLAGVGTVLGLGLLGMSVAMWRGFEGAPLPRRVASLCLPRMQARQLLGLSARMHEVAGRWLRDRLPALARGAHGPWVAPAVAAMALLIVLPIPFGNVLPSLALIALGLGRLFRDGAAVAAAAGLATLALAGSAGLLLLAWQTGAWLAS